MYMKYKKFLIFFAIVACIAVAAPSFLPVDAEPWGLPPVGPPGGNLEEIINISKSPTAGPQYKEGALGIGANLYVFTQPLSAIINGNVSIGYGNSYSFPEALKIRRNLTVDRLGIGSISPDSSVRLNVDGAVYLTQADISNTASVRSFAAYTPFFEIVKRTCDAANYCTVMCNPNKHGTLMGGGCFSDGGPQADHDALYASYPDSYHHQWICKTQRAHRITAYAMCPYKKPYP